jgi:hypothetical protein
LDANDHFDEDLFEADPDLDQPSNYCGSRTGPWCKDTDPTDPDFDPQHCHSLKQLLQTGV